MPRSRYTVSVLAEQANIDPEEALLRLWDEDIDYVSTSGSKVRRHDLDDARRALGLLGRDKLASPSAWQALLGLQDIAFRDLTISQDLEYSRTGRLTGKSIRKLQAYARGATPDSQKSGAGQEDSSTEVSTEFGAPSRQPEKTPFVWRTIGKERHIKHLTYDDVYAIHEELVEYFYGHSDPIEPAGVRDSNLLASAIDRPRTSLGGEKKYPTVEMAAASLLHSLILNHALYNGNKRTALVATLAFLDINRLTFTCSEDAIRRQVLRIARHTVVPPGLDRTADRETLAIAEWISKNTRPIKLGDRPIAFRKLHKLLRQFDCEIEQIQGGSQVTITRSIMKRSFWGRQSSETLSSQVAYYGPGREVDKISIAKVRKELRLDDNNGVDSAAFYENAPAAAGELIERFRRTLRHLSRI